MRLTKIYTRTGDDGTTGLAAGSRVGKDDPQVEACGAVDELNSALGAALAAGLVNELTAPLRRIQSELLNLGGEISLIGAPKERRPPEPLIQPRHVEALEKECDLFNAKLSPLPDFILPAGGPGATSLHLARAICRRAERRAIALARTRPVPPDVVRYLNRLSDLLFILARYENLARGVAERDQPHADLAHDAAERFPGHAAPDAEFLLPQNDLRAAPLDATQEHLRHGVDLRPHVRRLRADRQRVRAQRHCFFFFHRRLPRTPSALTPR